MKKKNDWRIYEQLVFGEDTDSIEQLDMAEDKEADLEPLPSLELEVTFCDHEKMTLIVVGTFLCEEEEYIALHPKADDDGVVILMRMAAGPDGEIELRHIEDDEEYGRAAEVFYQTIEDGGNGTGERD